MGPVGELVVRECKASEFADCDVVFSGLDSDVAGEIGKNFFLLLRSYHHGQIRA
jgi:aspartate-semialdehyde dehydrogenase